MYILHENIGRGLENCSLAISKKIARVSHFDLEGWRQQRSGVLNRVQSFG